MSKQTTQGFNFTGEMFTASVRPWQESPFSLCFKNGAKLTLNPDGSGTFEGDADEAAQMFFDGVVKLHNLQYQKLEAAEKRIAELEAQMLTVKLPDEVSREQEQYREEVIEIHRNAGVAVDGE